MVDAPCGPSHLLIVEPPRAHEIASMTRKYVLLIVLASLSGCNGAPSRNILGSYFPSWMVCALVGIAVAGIARAVFKSTGILQELPVPFVVILAIGCAATFALWLLWLA
jgi:YtcA family